MDPMLQYSHEDEERVYFQCNKSKYQEYTSEKSCPICLESKKDQGILDCGHYTCLKCILRLEKNECSLCRKTLSAPWLKGDLLAFIQENFEKHAEQRREEQVAQDSLIASIMESENNISFINPIDFIRSALGGNFMYFTVVEEEENQEETNAQEEDNDSDVSID